MVLRAQGELDQAFEHLAAALAIAREMGNREMEATASSNLAATRFDRGDLPGARADLEAALALRLECGRSLLGRRHPEQSGRSQQRAG